MHFPLLVVGTVWRAAAQLLPQGQGAKPDAAELVAALKRQVFLLYGGPAVELRLHVYAVLVRLGDVGRFQCQLQDVRVAADEVEQQLRGGEAEGVVREVQARERRVCLQRAVQGAHAVVVELCVSQVKGVEVTADLDDVGNNT